MPDRHAQQSRDGPSKRRTKKNSPARAAPDAVPLAGELERLRNAEKQLRELVEFDSALLNSAPNPIVVTRFDTSISFVNPAFETLTGFTFGEVNGVKSPYPWWPQDMTQQYESQNLPGRGLPVNVLERVYVKKNGERLWISLRISPVAEPGGAPKYFIANWTDMTEHKREEEKRIHRRARLEKILDSLGEGIILWDKELKIADANAEAQRIFGLSRSELIGKPYRLCEWPASLDWERIAPDGTPMPDEESAGFLAWTLKRPVRDIELGQRSRQGEITWLTTRAEPIFAPDGSLEYVLCAFADITEQKRTRDEREHYLSESINAQEEERKRISRELHDDLAPSLSMLALDVDAIVQRQPDLSAQTADTLRRIRESAGVLSEKIRQFSHELYPSVLESFGLTEALSTLVDEACTRYGIDISLNSSGPFRRLPPSTERALFRIAQEALNNVHKHSGASQASVDIFYSNQRVRLTISDNGKGFNPFVEGRAALHRGSLGLMSMKERAAFIGAELKVDSSPGHGTRIAADLRQQNQGS